MNYSRAIFLISDDVRAVACTYEEHDNAKRTVFKTLDQNIRVDDYVVIPTDTRHHMTVVKVVEVDLEPDLEASAEMEWIIGRVDRANFEDIARQERDAIAKIRNAEMRRKKAELRKALLDDQGAQEIKALPISTLNGDAPDTIEGTAE